MLSSSECILTVHRAQLLLYSSLAKSPRRSIQCTPEFRNIRMVRWGALATHINFRNVRILHRTVNRSSIEWHCWRASRPRTHLLIPSPLKVKQSLLQGLPGARRNVVAFLKDDTCQRFNVHFWSQFFQMDSEKSNFLGETFASGPYTFSDVQSIQHSQTLLAFSECFGNLQEPCFENFQSIFKSFFTWKIRIN